MKNKTEIFAGIMFIVALMFLEITLSGAKTLGDAVHGEQYITIAAVSQLGVAIPQLQSMTAWQMNIIAALCFLPSFYLMAKKGFSRLIILVPICFILIVSEFYFPLQVSVFMMRYWLLVILWIIFNIYIRDNNYLYASAIVAVLWDFNSAIWGLRHGMPGVPVPYYGDYYTHSAARFPLV